MALNNEDMIAASYLLVQLHDLEVMHQDTPGTLWGSDPVFMVRAMDVNVALVGIHVTTLIFARFQAPQPKDSGSDEVIGGFVRGPLAEM